MGTKKWTAVEYDAAKYLKSSIGSKLQRVELPRTMLVQVIIDLDGEAGDADVPRLHVREAAPAANSAPASASTLASS